MESRIRKRGFPPSTVANGDVVHILINTARTTPQIVITRLQDNIPLDEIFTGSYDGTKIKGYNNIEHGTISACGGMNEMGHKDFDSAPKIGALSEHIALTIGPVAGGWSYQTSVSRMTCKDMPTQYIICSGQNCWWGSGNYNYFLADNFSGKKISFLSKWQANKCRNYK